ncbi:MAG: type II toxin-antitoxin system VapC family toxin [Terriglobales bacterium]
MIIVDTNVLSELMRVPPATAVMDWFAAQHATSLYTTAISEAEIYYGIELLPKGRRREQLRKAADSMFAEDFANRVLGFDSDAARAFSTIAALRRSAGRPISYADAQILAIARSHSAKVATRNTADFEGCGVDLLDPWRRT